VLYHLSHISKSILLWLLWRWGVTKYFDGADLEVASNYNLRLKVASNYNLHGVSLPCRIIGVSHQHPTIDDELLVRPY
jgi:hypothetical protein